MMNEETSEKSVQVAVQVTKRAALILLRKAAQKLQQQKTALQANRRAAKAYGKEHPKGKQTVKQLKAIGVTEIDAEGQKFDQNLHNAVMQAESDEKHPSGTVVQVLQKGYMYHDKVLRHSMVSVAK